MLSLTDQTGNVITLYQLPGRIISLVPSQTELLFDLKLDEEVIGITKFCVHPDKWFTTKTRIGGTKTINISKVKSLQPDLIIANKEENVKEQIEELRLIAPVYVSDISNLEDALQMITDVGQLVSKDEKAKHLASEIQASFEELETNSQYSTINSQPYNINSSTYHPTQLNQPNAAYLIWKDPYMAAGGDTFINDMMKRCGFKNVFKSFHRYPQIEICPLSSVNCQLLLLSTEPYPFTQKHIDELQPHLPDTKIVLADGEMFSWYGSRLLYAADYFKKLIALVQP
jgi:ABC-type Fe3+-hydroxamate transport system substrate-binding protein